MRRRLRLASWVAAGLSLLLLRAAAPVAQEVTGPALKAAFLFNFVKFTQWPADVLPDAAPLDMCVVNDAAVTSALTAAVNGRVVLGHQIRVREASPSDSLENCHLVYVSGARSTALKVLSRVGRAPVFTVSDVHAFTETGGVAQLHVQQGQLRFAVDVETARKARLQISSRLLVLARQP